MQKPNGYDEAQVSQERDQIELGGHYCVVKQVSETKSSTGKDMIVVLFDFCSPDKQSGYFMDVFKNDIREEKKWPFAGSKYILVSDYNDPNKTSRAFKTFCTCIEKSNNYSIKWGDDNWAQQFKGKKIGAVYGEEENEYDGRTFMRQVVKWFCSFDSVKDQKVPEPKYLKADHSVAPKTAAPAGSETWMNVADAVEEVIPF